jgi:hypothetical protein
MLNTLSWRRELRPFVPAINGGTKRGINRIGKRNSFTTALADINAKRIPKTENPKEKRERISRNSKKGGKGIFRNTEKITISTIPEITININTELTFPMNMRCL